MKINIVFQHIDPTKGGIENSSYYLYKELAVQYDMHGASKEVDDKIKLYGVTYFPEPNNGFYKGYRWLIKSNKWQYRNSVDRKNTYNIGMTWLYSIGAYIAKKKYGTPYLCLVHGDEVYLDCKVGSLKKKMARRIQRSLAKKVLGNADALCINSKNTQIILHKTIVNPREIIIHPGINFVQLDTTWKRKDEFIIFSIGRHVERKGFRNVILSMPEIKKRIPNVKYYLAGDGPLRKEFEVMVDEMDLRDCVEFLGRIDEDEKYRMFQECDVLIMPSYEISEKATIEGFGIVYIEANMAGRYAVGTNCGGIPDAINEGVTGHLLADAQPETIAKDIYDIYCNLDNLYTKEMIEARVEWAKKHSFVNISKQYEEVMFGINKYPIFWE